METVLFSAIKREKIHVGQGNAERYYSAELVVDGLETPYQFKIRRDPFWPLAVLVREDSDIVPLLRIGDIVNVKYYYANAHYEPVCRDTSIRDILKIDTGCFSGHYQVNLEILHEREQKCACAN